MSRLTRVIAAAAIAAGAITAAAAPASHAVAHDTWTNQPSSVSWG